MLLNGSQNMRPTRLIVEHQSRLPAVFSRWLEERLARIIRERGRASLALPGGSVASAFFPELARLSLNWGRIDLFWGDERAVPPDDADSNFALAERLLIQPAGIPATSVHRVPGDQRPLLEAADSYSQTLLDVLGTPPRLDVVLLGLGPDGHVCSLFPDHAVLRASGWVAAVNDSPKPPPERITLTLDTLLHARTLVLAALGASKAPIVRQVLDDDATLPAYHALAGASESVVVLDEGAASQLPHTAKN